MGVIILQTKKVTCDCESRINPKNRNGEIAFSAVKVYSREGSQDRGQWARAQGPPHSRVYIFFEYFQKYSIIHYLYHSLSLGNLVIGWCPRGSTTSINMCSWYLSVIARLPYSFRAPTRS